MPLRLSLTYTFSASPDRLWPIVADTDRLNRVLGLPDMRYQPLAEESEVGRLKVRARQLALVAFEEEPFEWVENESYRVQRHFPGGPFRSFEGGTTLVPVEGGTELRIEAEFQPRTVVAGALFAVIRRKTKQEWDRFAQRIRRYLAGETEFVYGDGIDRATSAARRQAAARLRNAAPEIAGEANADRLLTHLREAGDVDLERIRPFALARRWGVDRHEVLRLCLRATRAGILDLSWDLICPNCRGGPARTPRLEELPDRVHCDSCHIAFDANFDRSVEVTFRPAARYRPVVSRQFCAAGPRNTPHIVAQCVIPAGVQREVRINLAPGAYRLRTLTGVAAATLEVESSGFRVQGSGAGVSSTGVGRSGLNAELPKGHPTRKPENSDSTTLNACLTSDGLCLGSQSIAAGPVRLLLRNETTKPAQLVLETASWDPDCATAAVVSVFQDFRDLFSSEVLAPHVQLAIETLPLLFTDLKGSTALYQQLGDASAFAVVRDHFTFLREAVADARGGIIKTIGDSVMAAFPDAAAALGCALRAQRELRAFNERQGRGLVILKIGLHQGPCIAVRGEERLDYFGSTVNIAARLHGESLGGDVVVSEAIMADPGAQPLLTGCHAEPFDADLRGIAERQRLWRLVP